MKQVVVDIQFLKGIGNSFVVKEMAIVSDNKIGHWVFKPHHGEIFVPRWIRNQNQYLKINHHGLVWEQGDTNLGEMANILVSHIGAGDCVYAKGDEKVKLLKSWGIDATELGSLLCPSAKKLSYEVLSCNSHARGTKVCALNQALKFSKWLDTEFQQLGKNNLNVYISESKDVRMLTK